MGSLTVHCMQPVIIHSNLTEVWYRDEIMRQYIEPYMRTHGPRVILQQDNARTHIANVV